MWSHGAFKVVQLVKHANGALSKRSSSPCFFSFPFRVVLVLLSFTMVSPVAFDCKVVEHFE